MNNGALILKSRNALNKSVMGIDLQAFIARVQKDGGEVVDINAVKETLAFVNNVGITPVNDVGIASPRWAVKKVNGRIVKLYSLLNAKADITVIYNASSGEISNKYGFSTLQLNPKNTAYVTGSDFTYDTSLISLNIYKPMQAANGTQISDDSNVFNIGNVKRVDNTVPSSTGKALLDTYFERKELADLPTKWSNVFYIRAGTAYMSSDTPSRLVDKDSSHFNAYTYYMDDKYISCARGGVFEYDLAHGATKAFEGTYKAEYANRGVSGSKTLHPLVGDIAEIWTVVGASKEVAKALSARATELYSI